MRGNSARRDKYFWPQGCGRRVEWDAAESMSTAKILAQHGWMRGVGTIGGRYSLATIGPACVSASHFLASFALLRALPPAHFGLFAFSLVVVGFSLGLSSALIGTPYTVAANQDRFSTDKVLTFFKANLLFSVLVGLVCSGIVYGMHPDAAMTAPLFGLFGFLATLRWFSRAHAYAVHAPVRVAIMDITYAGVLIAGLAAVWLLHDLTMDTAIAAFISAAAASVAASGTGYLKSQFIKAFAGHLRGYASIWRNQSRWTLLGAVTTEATANAHAYMVTLMAGPAAFAPLAVGALFMRPISMCSNSLTQLERPAMARAIVAGEASEALHRSRHYRWALSLVWLATVAVAAVILVRFPGLIVTKNYDLVTVMEVTGLLALVEAVQLWISPEIALLQAAGKFRQLAEATVLSSIVTIMVGFSLLLTFGPVASLGGLLSGVIVLARCMTRLRRQFERSFPEHGGLRSAGRAARFPPTGIVPSQLANSRADQKALADPVLSN